MIRVLLSCALLTLTGAAWTLPARAASGAGATSLQIPPDARSEAMGRAPMALTRGPNAAWSNPGGLGLSHGIQATTMHVQLVPDLAPDVRYRHRSVMAGWSPPGLEVSLGGGALPVNLTAAYSYTHIGYGTEPFGLPPGAAEPTERMHGGAVAVGLGEFVGVGAAMERLKFDLVAPPDGPGSASATAWNYGALVRVPVEYNAAHRTGAAVSLGEHPDHTVRVTPAAGLAWVHRGADFEYETGGSDPLPRTRREAVGLDIDAFPVSEFLPHPNPIAARILRDVHFVSVSAALARDKDLNAPYGTAATRPPMVSRNEWEGIGNYRGVEVKILNIFAWRWGRINDEPSGITGDSHGWGISLLGYAGADFADIPQVPGLDRLEKWSYWVRIPLDWE